MIWLLLCAAFLWGGLRFRHMRIFSCCLFGWGLIFILFFLAD